MLFINSYNISFLTFLLFYYIIINILDIFRAIKNMKIKENYYRRIGFPKKQLLINETSGKKRFIIACN